MPTKQEKKKKKEQTSLDELAQGQKPDFIENSRAREKVSELKEKAENLYQGTGNPLTQGEAEKQTQLQNKIEQIAEQAGIDPSEVSTPTENDRPTTVGIETGVTKEQVKTGEAKVINARDEAKETKINAQRKQDFIKKSKADEFTFKPSNQEQRTISREQALNRLEQTEQKAASQLTKTQELLGRIERIQRNQDTSTGNTSGDAPRPVQPTRRIKGDNLVTKREREQNLNQKSNLGLITTQLSESAEVIGASAGSALEATTGKDFGLPTNIDTQIRQSAEPLGKIQSRTTQFIDKEFNQGLKNILNDQKTTAGEIPSPITAATTFGSGMLEQKLEQFTGTQDRQNLESEINQNRIIVNQGQSFAAQSLAKELPEKTLFELPASAGKVTQASTGQLGKVLNQAKKGWLGPKGIITQSAKNPVKFGLGEIGADVALDLAGGVVVPQSIQSDVPGTASKTVSSAANKIQTTVPTKAQAKDVLTNTRKGSVQLQNQQQNAEPEPDIGPGTKDTVEIQPFIQQDKLLDLESTTQQSTQTETVSKPKSISSPFTDAIAKPESVATPDFIDESLTGTQATTETTPQVQAIADTFAITETQTETVTQTPAINQNQTPTNTQNPLIQGESENSGVFFEEEQKNNDERNFQFAPSLDSIITGNTITEKQAKKQGLFNETFSGLESRPVIIDKNNSNQKNTDITNLI